MKPRLGLSLTLLTGLLLSACGVGQAPDVTKPNITLTISPAELTANGSATFEATATDKVGVTEVQFYDGDKLIATDREAPFTVSQGYTAADNGTHTIRAVAVDAAGNRGEATGVLTVRIQTPPQSDTEDPQVSLTASPQTLTAAGTVKLTATATDNVGVTKVTFYRGSTKISEDATAPYEATDNLTAAENGTVTYRAVAVDAAGNMAETTTNVTVNITTTPPPPTDTVNPMADLVILENSPKMYTVNVTASDASGIDRVNIYDNGKLVATGTTASYSTTLSYTAAQNGPHVIMVEVYDKAGNKTEVRKTITVDVDEVKPIVSVMADPATLTLPGTVNLTATATDASGVVKVEFYADGKLIATDTQAPYTASIDYVFADNGEHTITVKAYDRYDNVGQSNTTIVVAIPDGFEPNDSVDAAAPLPIGTPLVGTVAGQSRDFDYFKFDAAAGDMLRLTVKSVSVNPASTLDPYVMILMPDGKTVLEKDDDSGAGLESDIRFNVPQTGTYTVVVTSFDILDDEQATDNKATNTYQIELTRR